MDITIRQKKLIFIILASSLLIFILVFGISTYYKERNDQEVHLDYEMMETAKVESNLCSSDELENQYRVCCAIEEGVKKGLLYDCTSQEYFKPGQGIYIVFDASRFDISYDPYFLRAYSDLNDEENKYILYETDVAIDKEEIFLIKILGTIPKEDEPFILLRLSTYPDDAFDGKDEQVILNREAKIFKE